MTWVWYGAFGLLMAAVALGAGVVAGRVASTRVADAVRRALAVEADARRSPPTRPIDGRTTALLNTDWNARRLDLVDQVHDLGEGAQPAALQSLLADLSEERRTMQRLTALLLLREAAEASDGILPDPLERELDRLEAALSAEARA